TPAHEACVLKDSRVYIQGTYKYPSGLKLIRKFWVQNPIKHVEPTDLIEVPQYSGRIKYFEESKQILALRLDNVTKSDEHMYCLRITTNIPKKQYLGYPGVALTVTELRVETPEHVTEGNTTHLTCRTDCRLPDTAAFTWYKNGQRILTEKQENILSLKPTQKDTGSSRCAVRGYEHLPSPAQTLTVRYVAVEVVSLLDVVLEGSWVTKPPSQNYTWFKGKTSVGQRQAYNIPFQIHAEDSGEYMYFSINYFFFLTLLSIIPSGEIVADSSVTLTCSSDANPPVQNYTWFKEGGTSPVGSGQNYITNSSGYYYSVSEHTIWLEIILGMILKMDKCVFRVSLFPELKLQYKNLPLDG
uniref:Ig-like domain-containing protein n=1 Tax=Electrophorus electricus TaxID=8005 RepID=A0AAY5EUB6_ELEEL